MALQKKPEYKYSQEPAFKIELPESNLTGPKKAGVQFVNGVGVLNYDVLYLWNPDLMLKKDGKFAQVAGASIEQWADWYSDKGFKVKEISYKESQELLKELGLNPEKFFTELEPPQPEPTEPEKQKKPKGKKEKKAAKEPAPHEKPGGLDEAAKKG